MKLTKEPTIKRINEMAERLYLKYNRSTNIEIDQWRYDTGGSSTRYRVFICSNAPAVHAIDITRKSWREFQEAFEELMKAPTPETEGDSK
jgi:hypothetical protein